MQEAEWDYFHLFGQLRPLQGGNLTRVADLDEAQHKLLSMQILSHCMIVRVNACTALQQPGETRST